MLLSSLLVTSDPHLTLYALFKIKFLNYGIFSIFQRNLFTYFAFKFIKYFTLWNKTEQFQNKKLHIDFFYCMLLNLKNWNLTHSNLKYFFLLFDQLNHFKLNQWISHNFKLKKNTKYLAILNSSWTGTIF